jgi:hypothetical protein
MLPVRDSQMDKIPSKETNLFYYGSENTKRSKIDTYQSTNYTFDINSKTSGSVGTVIITPQAGLSHLWVGVKLPSAPQGLDSYDGLALGTGWGFSLIESMTYRYGSSAPFSLSGNALRVAACVNAGNAGEKEQLMSAFGGQACSGEQIADDNLYSYFPLTLAHVSSESGSEVRAPIDTSMLNGPITINIQWADFSKVFAKSPAFGAGTVNIALSEAWVGTRQIIPMYSDDKMVLKNGQVYNYPIKFYQPPNAIPLAKSVSPQTVNLVGIKSGQCQGIYTWVVKSGGAASEVYKANQNIFVPLKDVKMTYAGTVLQYMRGNGAAAAFMDTLFQDCPSYFTATQISLVGAGAEADWNTTTVPKISYFQHYPFIQRFEGQSDSCLLQNGVRVDSGSIQLDLAINDLTFDDTADYTLYYMPWFSAALSLDAGGGCNYLF